MKLNRLIALLIISVATTSVFSKAANNSYDDQNNTGIVTPDTANAVRLIENFTTDTNGNLLVCTRPHEHDGKNCLAPNGNKQWQHVREIVPAGRFYVGFKVVSGAHGYRLLEVYWR